MTDTRTLDDLKAELSLANAANVTLRKTIHDLHTLVARAEPTHAANVTLRKTITYLYGSLTKIQTTINECHRIADRHGNPAMSLVERVKIMKRSIS